MLHFAESATATNRNKEQDVATNLYAHSYARLVPMVATFGTYHSMREVRVEVRLGSGESRLLAPALALSKLSGLTTRVWV